MKTVLNQREIESITINELFNVAYTPTEVLQAEEDRRVRRVNLDKAVTLGRSNKTKTLIIFLTTSGYKQVSAVVVMVNNKGVTLEHDHFIPMSTIYSVDMI